ncbi:unnamed protein product [Aspergillus oryzae]|uniref:Unnamed protein product n=1 Tax=Aspergillus oryzae TaxID=5062 RepID=A0AAN4YGV8_ASPOZ|nr:unnamed protein product [Aspergillus oryzae]
MTLLQNIVSETPLAAGSALLTAIIVAYVIYQRYLHPLAKYPGPFLASITDLWQVHQFLSLQQPYNLTALHERYGPIVRYGPDKLSITHESAVPTIYQKSAKSMPKTEFYDAYGAAHPNVFGMRDEVVSLRLRSEIMQLMVLDALGEAASYVSQLFFELHQGDGRKALHYYMIDVLGELAFSRSFGVQEADDESRIPPVIEHSLLAAVTGAWPTMTMTLKRWLPYMPHAGLRRLFAGRKACADLASSSVQRRLRDLNDGGSSVGVQNRKDILTNLIKAKHPETGERLTQTDLETEAFGFMYCTPI